MVDKYILRTPDLSDSRIVLKSGKDSVMETVQSENPHSYSADPLPQEQVVSEQDVAEKYREYLNSLAELEQEKNKLDAVAKKLFEDREQLEAEKLNYREQLERQVRKEVEDRVGQEYAERNAELLSLIDTLAECKTGEIARFDDELIAVVYEAVCKIIGQAMTDKSIVTAMVREVISHAQDRMQMVIRVSPHDFDIIQAAKELLSRGLSNRLEVIADDHVGYGGCILETDAGTIDGRLEQQLNSLLELLLDERERSMTALV